jgi:hypothetical protein
VLAQALNAVSPGFTLNLRALWEATNNRWNQWVLNYSQARQMDLLRNLGFSAPDWQDLSTVLIGLIVAASLTGAGWNWWNRLRRDPWLQALETARQQVKAIGLPVAPGCTPRALALLLQTDPRANPLAVQWLLQLEALRYGKTDAAGALRTARMQLRTMRWLSP